MEVLVAMVIMIVGLFAVAQLLAVSAGMHTLARRTTEASMLGSTKLDELMKLNLATAPAVQISPASPDPLTQNVANYFDQAGGGYTRRWRVEAGPTGADTRLVTVRVIPPVAGQSWSKAVDLTTILRQW